MRALFFIIFGVGAGFVIISFLLGEVFGLFESGGHGDIHVDTHTDADMHIHGGEEVSPLKPKVIAVFLTVFGGVGLLLYERMGILQVVGAAAFLALAVAYVMYRYIIVPLYKLQNTSAVDKQSLIGSSAVVTEKIFQGGYGKITYTVNGNTYTAPAKAENGGEIEKKTPVEIIYIEKSTYFVRKKY